MKNILVFDTETTGDFDEPMIYDFGYKIVSPQGETLFTRNALVQEIFESNFLMQKAFYSSKVKEYRRTLADNEIDIQPFRLLIKEFISVARKYRVEIISAYNLAFDMTALNTTMRITYSEGFNKKILEKLTNQKNKKLVCIWNLACETILNTDEYRQFATDNELVSPKGNYKTNAEASYKFITNNINFVEKHTALADVDIEIDILFHIMKEYTGHMTYGIHYGSWKKVQK